MNHTGPETVEPSTFIDDQIQGAIFRPLKSYDDQRGWLIEVYREDELPTENHSVMAYVSQTLPGVARGPHEHVDQSDYFAFIGPGDFMLYLWDTRIHSPTWGYQMKVVVGESNKQTVIVPPGVVHAYKNISDYPGVVFNAPNRLYAGEGKKEPVDEIRHEDREDGMYQLD